jgi:hypothetical protein
MSPLPITTSSSVIIPCGLDCTQAKPIRDGGDTWVYCGRPERNNCVARLDHDCPCFSPASSAGEVAPIAAAGH